jgi:outer membrane protein W
MSTKTIKTFAAGALIASALFTNANADEIKPYVGLEVSTLKADIATINGFDYGQVYEDQYNAISPYFGARIGKHFGLEAGYTQTSSESKAASGVISGITVSTDIETELSALTLDALGYYPVSKNLELIGQAGFGFYEVDTSGTVTVSSSTPVPIAGSDDSIGYRVGAGFLYNINDKFAVRTLVRHTILDFDVVDSATSVSVGGSYNF